MLVGGRDCRTQFRKETTHGPFRQSLVLSGHKWFQRIFFSNCGRTDDGTQSDDEKRGAYYFLSVVKSQKNSWLQQ